MDIKDVKVGGTYYIPVEVISVDDEVQAYYAKRKEKGLWDEFDAVDMVTKEEVVGTEIDDRTDFWKRDSESAHEEIRKLQKLLNSKEEGMRKIEEYADQLKKIADDLGDENEKLRAESPKVEALRKALKGQGNDIRRKNAIINALAERVVYLEGEMGKNG